MKKFIPTLLFGALALLVLSMSSCKKKDNKVKDEVQNNVQSGTWRITKFVDSGNDETGYFVNYNFTFAGSETLTTTNGSSTHTGTWSISNKSSSDDSQDDLDFNILFNTNNNFDELSDDWHFVSQSSTKVELIDVSGGNGGTDYLTFEKN